MKNNQRSKRIIIAFILIVIALCIYDILRNRQPNVSRTTEAEMCETVTPEGERTWLWSMEIPANDAKAVDAADAEYNGMYSHYVVDETIGSTKAAVYDLNSTDDQKIVVHTFEYNDTTLCNYTMLFDKNKRCALWVAFKNNLTDYKDNDAGRNDDWRYDPALPEDWQPNLSSAYPGSTYDRGHQTASNDRQTTEIQNRQTFYYSNMTPQFGLLNRGQWAKLEGNIQSLWSGLAEGDEVYVVTGPIFGEDVSYVKDKSGNDCALPTGFFKCAIIASYNTDGTLVSCTGHAYMMNTNSSNTVATRTSIDAIEALTGFDFFYLLPDSFEAAAEAMGGEGL